MICILVLKDVSIHTYQPKCLRIWWLIFFLLSLVSINQNIVFLKEPNFEELIVCVLCNETISWNLIVSISNAFFPFLFFFFFFWFWSQRNCLIIWNKEEPHFNICNCPLFNICVVFWAQDARYWIKTKLLENLKAPAPIFLFIVYMGYLFNL